MKSLSNFRITVGIISYNRLGYLKEAIDSVLQQSYKNFELIISNDYPDITVTFDSIGIKNDPRIKIVNQTANLGALDNMNYLLSIAKGEWFVWLSEDDLLHPEFLMLAHNIILNNHKKNIVGFFSNYISTPSPSGVFPVALKSNATLIDSSSCGMSNFILNYSARKYPLVGECGVMHTGTLKKISGIPKLGDGVGHYCDTLIPILLLQHGSICWLDEKLIFFRACPDSVSHSSADFQAYTSAEADFLKIIRRVCVDKNIIKSLDEIISNMIMWFMLVEWQVLLRSKSLTKFSALVIFIKYQLNVNFPRLTFKHKVTHIIFLIIRLVLIIYKKIHTHARKFFSYNLRKKAR